MPLPQTSTKIALTLLESGRVSSAGHQATMAGSVVGQVTLVCVAVWGFSRVLPDNAAPLSDRPTFLAPLHQERPRPVQEKLSYAALGGVASPEPQPRVGELTDASRVSTVAAPDRVGGGDEKPPSEAHAEDQSRAYSEIEVDSAAARDPDSEGPVYPPTLMAKGIQGSVLATFVVDETGRPDVNTYLALESTDTLFALAVRNALPRMKFRPAKRNNIPVRQQVEQRFSFRVVKVPVATPSTPATPAA